MIWIIGCGNMGISYAKVLKKVKKDFIVIGRGEKSATSFENQIGDKVFTGGLNSFLMSSPRIPNSVIVAVNIEELFKTTVSLIKYGIKKILLEKPGGINLTQILKLYEMSIHYKVKVFIAYNRRFYSSVYKAKELIREDGDILSINFEFTELVQKIEKQKKPLDVKEKLFLNNSTHVLDLVFHFAGKPKKISSYHSRGLDWHPAASVFVGSGITDKNILFSYSANWESAGRWGVEILTKNNRFKFQPLEELKVQKNGEFHFNKVKLDDTLDINFKPGLYRMVVDFLNGKIYDHCSLKEHNKLLKNYYKIANYKIE